MKKIIAAAVLAVAVAVIAGINGISGVREKTVYAMDTVITVKIKGSSDDMNAIVDIINKYDRMFNAYNTDSEVYAVNHGKTNISDDFKEIMEECKEASLITDGAFDFTLKPLSDLWGISKGKSKIPDEGEIKKALERTGFEKVEIHNNEIKLSDREIDLGGAVKGFVTEKIRSEIKKRGIKKAVVDLGGNIYVYNSKKDVAVGIQEPFAQRGNAVFAIDVNDKAVVSSGTYERYFEKDGKVYHHIFDRNTGYPTDNGISSVTVVGNGTITDCLSTAIMVMGQEKAYELYKKWENIEFIIIRGNKIYATDGILNKIRLLNDKYSLYALK